MSSFKPIRNRPALSKKAEFEGPLAGKAAQEELYNVTTQSDEGTNVLRPVNMVLEDNETITVLDDDATSPTTPSESNEAMAAPQFEKLSASDIAASSNKVKQNEIRRVMVPQHRLTPLRKHWAKLVEPLVVHLKLQVRMNVRKKCVEIRNSPTTPEVAFLQKGADFVKAFMLGFNIEDAIALIRLDDLFLESFEIKDVKRLTGDSLSRCIGRLSGTDGKTKNAIENATRTRIVLADSHLHILGAFQNIKFARNAISSLILGSPPGKVYNRLRSVSRRLLERG